MMRESITIHYIDQSLLYIDIILKRKVAFLLIFSIDKTSCVCYTFVMEEKITRLIDWMTTPEIPFASKLTHVGDSVLHNHSFFEILPSIVTHFGVLGE